MRTSRRRSLAIAVAVLAALVGGVLLPPAGAVDPDNELVSVSSDETQGNADSRVPATSADGRFVAFESGASNLVAGDTNGVPDVFVRDRSTGETTRVSVSSGGDQADGGSAEAAISANGRFVAFWSNATNLVAGDTNGVRDVFLHDRTTGSTERVSVADDESQADGESFAPSVSDDGRFVAFESAATNLVTADANGMNDVFVRDREAGSTEIASVSSEEAPGADGHSRAPSISGDGTFVAFASDASTLVAGDTNGASDIFVRNRADGTTSRVSTTGDGSQADGPSGANFGPDISADGRYVAFESAATNLVEGDTNGNVDVFRKDRATGAVLRASVASDGTQGNADSAGAGQSAPAISRDGRFLSFESAASNLVPGDGNGLNDVFAHDSITRETVRVSVASDPNGVSGAPALAGVPDVAFHSGASNLVADDNNSAFDIFARQYFEEKGYYILDDQGGIFAFGEAQFFGSRPGLIEAGVNIGPARVVDLATTPSGNGYYVLDEVGGIFTFGDAQFHGSLPGRAAAGVDVGDADSIDIAATATGEGYYILDAQGGVHTFGDATFHGSLPGLRDSGIEIGDSQGIDLATDPTGGGYFILDNVGGIFTFGGAEFKGSVPGLRQSGIEIGQAQSIRLEVTATGEGYLILDAVGGIFAFGDGQFHGSIPGLKNAGVEIGPAMGVDLGMTPGSAGYLILDNVGGIFTFGDGEFLGSVPALREAGVPIGDADSIRLDIVSGMVGG